MTVYLLGIAGSLRKHSLNQALLRVASELLPANTKLEIADISDIPLYNPDVEREHGFPESVSELRAQVARADGLVFATPEYNWSVSGVLKNTIDWLSRRPDPPMAGKVAAVMGSGGRLGTAYSQADLRRILGHLNVRIIDRPVVMIARGSEHFDDELQLTDPRYRAQVEGLLAELVKEIDMRHPRSD